MLVEPNIDIDDLKHINLTGKVCAAVRSDSRLDLPPSPGTRPPPRGRPTMLDVLATSSRLANWWSCKKLVMLRQRWD